MVDETRLSKGGCIAAALVVLAALAVVMLWTCFEKIPADQIGVRTVATTAGVEEKDHKAGYVLAIPGYHTVRLWSPTWMNLKETLQVRGSDQYTTTVDISVLYRIQPGKCHQVAKTFKDETHIRDIARNALTGSASEILAQMKTEDFFNSKVRDQKADEAQKAMDERLKPNGLEIAHVLLRNIVYDPKFEQQLLQKQLAGQRKSLEISKGLLAGAQTETDLIKRKAEAEVKQIEEGKRQEIENLTADTDRKVAQLMQDAKFEAAEIAAKAESSKRQKIAQADFLKAQAQAEGTAALSRVYTRPGASYYFARQALEGITLGEIEVNSNNFNPLDMEKLLQALGLNLKSSSPAAPAAAPSQKPQ